MNDLPHYTKLSQHGGLQTTQQAEETVDLMALVATVWQGKWLIALTTCCALLMGGYSAFVSAVPTFRSTAVLILDTRAEGVVDFDTVIGGIKGDDTEVNTEVEILRSRGLMGKVTDRLNLVSDPEFNATLKEPSGFALFKKEAKTQIKSVLGLTTQEIELTPEEEARRIRAKAVSALQDKVTVKNVPLSYVFHVTVETESARKSALIANTISQIYILNQLEVKFEATEQATTWLTGRVSDLQMELERSVAKVAEFNSSTSLVSLESLQGQEVQLKDIRERTNAADSALTAINENIALLKQAGTPAEQAAAAGDAQLTRMLNADAATFNQSAFAARFAQVLRRQELEASRKTQQLVALRASAADLEAQINSRSQDLITLQQLERESEAVRLLYEYFLSRLKETSAQQGIQNADSRVLSQAEVSTEPASPQKSRILAVSMVFGMLAGIGLVLLREMRNTGFRNARDLEDFTGYAVLGQIPQIPSRRRGDILPYLKRKPASAAAEAIRNLRTSLQMTNVDKPPQVIVCTSSLPHEGKTTNTLALAQHFSGLNQSVLVIEGDLRRRTVRFYFNGRAQRGRPPEKGLVSLLAGESTLEDVVIKDTGYGFDMICGEDSPVNASDLFSTRKFEALLADLRTRYDIILIDTPPVLVVPEGRIIAKLADAVLLVVEWNSTSRRQLEETIRLFHNSQQKLTGLVLSQINTRRMRKMGQYTYVSYAGNYYKN